MYDLGVMTFWDSCRLFSSVALFLHIIAGSPVLWTWTASSAMKPFQSKDVKVWLRELGEPKWPLSKGSNEFMESSNNERIELGESKTRLFVRNEEAKGKL